MSTATLVESDRKIVEILMSKIHSDEEFNCRGYIPPSDVIELARDIAKNGLQYPILVQPYDDNHREKTGKDYRILSGHRRHTAFLVNQAERIPCIVRDDIISEAQALLINLNENIQRKELNILQEAKAVKRLLELDMTQDAIAKTLQKSRPWAQTRCYVLDFPSDIQEAIGEGWISQAQIHQIHALPTIDEQYAAVRHIKDAKLNAQTKRLKVNIPQAPKKENLLKAKHRNKEEIETLLDHIMGAISPNFATRCLAWAAGNISTFDVLKDLENEADNQGKYYTLPLEGLPGL